MLHCYSRKKHKQIKTPLYLNASDERGSSWLSMETHFTINWLVFKGAPGLFDGFLSQDNYKLFLFQSEQLHLQASLPGSIFLRRQSNAVSCCLSEILFIYSIDKSSLESNPQHGKKLIRFSFWTFWLLRRGLLQRFSPNLTGDGWSETQRSFMARTFFQSSKFHHYWEEKLHFAHRERGNGGFSYNEQNSLRPGYQKNDLLPPYETLKPWRCCRRGSIKKDYVDFITHPLRGFLTRSQGSLQWMENMKPLNIKQ